MSCYQNNYFANFESSIWCRDEGWAAFTQHPWAPAPQCDSSMSSICLHIGAERYDHCAPGFEYCLDAPMSMPAGSMQAASFQPYSD